MDTFRVGGIASGMDTNALVEQLMQRARQPLSRLEGKVSLATLRKNVFQSLSTDLVGIKTDLLNLRLEATFKSKTLNSSDTAIVGATATTNAALGSHTVNVSQTAKNGYWYSSFTRVRLADEAAGITGTTGLPGQYDQIEGTHSVNVAYDGVSKYIAKDTFTLDRLGTLDRFTANNQVDTTTFMNPGGRLPADVSGTIQFAIDGNTTTEISLDALADEELNTVLRKMEDGVNARLNEHFGTSGIQYAAVRADYDGASGWNVNITNVSNEDYTIEAVGGTLQSELGLDGGFSTSQADTIDKYYAATDLASLQAKMNQSYGGLIAGVTINGTLTEGTFELVQDSSLNVKTESYSRVLGATVSSGAGLDTAVTGLQNAGFDRTPSESTNGTFSINGVKIAIDDYTTLSVNDVIGKINSSGAGVTASYDSANDRMILTNNDPGADSISLGELSDTSDFLKTSKLSVLTGATKTLGSTKGAISTSSTLSEAGFTSTPTSGTFTINGVSIYINNQEDTLSDVISKVNKSGAGVTMSYDGSRDRITVVSDTVGFVSFGSASDTSSFLTSANLTRYQNVTTSLGHEGQYAEVEVDGVTHIRDTNTIDDIIDGVTLTLRSASSTTVTLDIGVDEERAVNAVAAYIQGHNEFMARLDVEMLTEDQRDYLDPLTDEKRNSMGEAEVEEYEELWNEYNTQSIIYSSSETRLLKTTLRTNLLSNISGITGAYNNLNDLGIDIAGGADYTVTKKGFLLTDSTDLDEIKQALKDNTEFMNAVRQNPDDVFTFFAEQDGETQGWARNMAGVIDNFTDTGGLIYNKIRPYGTIDRELANYMERMSQEEYRLDLQLDRLWQQFTAMETALAEMQSQGDYMAQLMAGLGGGGK